MHHYDTVYSAGLRLFLGLVSYALLFPLLDDNIVALCITAFVYVMGKWVDTLDTIYRRRYSTLLETAGIITGIILLAESIILMASNLKTVKDDLSITILIYVYIGAASIFVIIDFTSFGNILKKFNTTSVKNTKNSKRKCEPKPNKNISEKNEERENQNEKQSQECST